MMMVADLEILKHVTVKEFNSFVDREVSKILEWTVQWLCKSLLHIWFRLVPRPGYKANCTVSLVPRPPFNTGLGMRLQYSYSRTQTPLQHWSGNETTVQLVQHWSGNETTVQLVSYPDPPSTLVWEWDYSTVSNGKQGGAWEWVSLSNIVLNVYLVEADTWVNFTRLPQNISQVLYLWDTSSKDSHIPITLPV